jgi:hypothetical protein
MKQPEMEKQPEIDKPPEKHRAEKEHSRAAQEKPAEKSSGIVQPMIDELRQHPKDAPAPLGAPPRGPVHPPQPEEQPAELDQDAGGGYNPDGTFPQT